MKTKTIIALTLSLWCPVLFAQNTTKGEILIEQLNCLQKVDSVLLDYLPTSFVEYYELCGDVDSPLYDKEDILHRLNSSQTIDKHVLIKKVVLLCIGGVPDVDHIAILHKYAIQYVRMYSKDVISILNMLPKSENVLFWRFLFGDIENRSIEYGEVVKIIDRLIGISYSYSSTVKEGYKTSILVTHLEK